MVNVVVCGVGGKMSGGEGLRLIRGGGWGCEGWGGGAVVCGFICMFVFLGDCCANLLSAILVSISLIPILLTPNFLLFYIRRRC